jgi:hypothetical protein
MCRTGDSEAKSEEFITGLITTVKLYSRAGQTREALGSLQPVSSLYSGLCHPLHSHCFCPLLYSAVIAVAAADAE